MGALMSVCGLGQLACCATSTACSCLSCIAPAAGPRVMYSFMLLLVTITGWIMTLPNVSDWLESKVPFCWGNKIDTVKNFFLSSNETKTTICQEVTGYLAVYRLMFATFMFFALFGLIMMKMRKSSDPRVKMHQGFWPVKFLLLIAGIVGAFYIPADSSFGQVWKNFGFIGSFLYLLIQVCFLVLFADELADSWVKEHEEGSKCYTALLVSVSLLNFILSIIGFILFYVYYGGSGCGLHKTFISINLIIVILLPIISVLPAVQEHNHHSGILQASFIGFYLTYMTWSALNSSPDEKCKLSFWSDSSNSNMDLTSFISLLICFACVIYSSIRLSSKEGFNRISGRADSESPGDENSEVEEDPSNISFFYWFLALSTLFLMMSLTNWFTPTESYQRFGESSSSLWIKMISSWFSALIFLWITVAPSVLHEYRDFN